MACRGTGHGRINECPWETLDGGKVKEHAIKEMVADQLAAVMKEQGLTKSQMAGRMKTSRRQLDRIFDPSIPSVTLDTLRRAANALGRSLRIELV